MKQYLGSELRGKFTEDAHFLFLLVDERTEPFKKVSCANS